MFTRKGIVRKNESYTIQTPYLNLNTTPTYFAFLTAHHPTALRRWAIDLSCFGG